ncbi:hypothetical protein RDI58_024386 [Solanum bulbocastanum]|uniref:Uncharacterized protein n=1 Tax=Solanum bulbocastanum TaxID=147425 RepID=A0AAN8T4U7_SOLBU
MPTRLLTIRGKVVDYGPKYIHSIYGFLDPDIEAFTTMNCESGSWLALKLCPSINVPWAITKDKIQFSDLMSEART